MIVWVSEELSVSKMNAWMNFRLASQNHHFEALLVETWDWHSWNQHKIPCAKLANSIHSGCTILAKTVQMAQGAALHTSLLVPENFISKYLQFTNKISAYFTSKSLTCQHTFICDFYPAALWLEGYVYYSQTVTVEDTRLHCVSLIFIPKWIGNFYSDPYVCRVKSGNDTENPILIIYIITAYFGFGSNILQWRDHFKRKKCPLTTCC